MIAVRPVDVTIDLRNSWVRDRRYAGMAQATVIIERKMEDLSLGRKLERDLIRQFCYSMERPAVTAVEAECRAVAAFRVVCDQRMAATS